MGKAVTPPFYYPQIDNVPGVTAIETLLFDYFDKNLYDWLYKYNNCYVENT